MRSMMVVVACLALASGCGKKDEEPAGAGNQSGTSGAGDKAGDKGGGAAAAPALKAIQVAAGQSASCALMSDGTARCWGRSDFGELGNGRKVADAATPVAVAGITGATALSMGGDPGDQGDLACVLGKDKSVTCWGYNRLIPLEKSETGVATPIPELKGATQIVMGGGTMFAAMPDGSAIGWGGATFNALNDGGSGDKGLTKIAGVSDVTMVAGGQNHGCALKKDSSVWCWGYTTPDKQLAQVPDVQATYIAAASAKTETCAITPEKKVTCWSSGIKAREIPDLANIKMLAGRTHWCALEESGAVWCWGNNSVGQIGNGEAGRTVGKPHKVEGVSAVHVDTGSRTTCAALASGGVKCWGYNQRGQLGDGTLMDRHTPTSVKHIQAATLPAAVDGADKAQESDVAMSWDGIPEGCTQGGKLTLVHPKHGDSIELVSAYATSQGGGKTIKVDLANYKLDPKNAWAKPRGKQLKVGLRFAKIDLKKKKEPLNVDKGTYSMDTDQDRLVHPSLTDRASNVTWARISLEGLDAGTAKITHLDESWVCGELALNAGKDMKLDGTFAAKLTQ